ncbi:glycosyltransferase [Streptomyces sp. NPDC005953]|uniref:glycosyltransferase family 2 protein n=1 Tax=Streptomyces sp. NPDC005953 TaxID=3156719 RepID=UPI0033D8745F
MRTRKACAWAVVILTAALIIAFHWQVGNTTWDVTGLFYIAVAATLMWMLGSSARRRSFAHQPVADGRVVVVVPAYNERPDLLHACVRSLVSQTRPPERIIVVDDGSDTPVEPLDLAGVVWMRQGNTGKRGAQMAGLAHVDAAEWADFVVTVDSDSVVAPDGIEQLLRAMSDPVVQAATSASCLVLNRTASIWTRVQDLEINLSNMVMRRARSSIGAVVPTSGAFAIYRAGILWDNSEDYLTEGTFGDDRRLSHYSLQRGQVVAVDEAVVQFEMPSTYRGAFTQRTRWFKGYMRYLPWEIRNFTGWPLALRCWNLTLVALYPLIVGYVLVAIPLLGGQVYWQMIAYWLVLLYMQTSLYLERPEMPFRSRLVVWLLFTPVLLVYQMLVIRPAMYYAATQTRRMGWVTRGAAV